MTYPLTCRSSDTVPKRRTALLAKADIPCLAKPDQQKDQSKFQITDQATCDRQNDRFAGRRQAGTIDQREN